MMLRRPRERGETMFDHVGLNVRDFERSRAFYRQALEPLGLTETAAFEEWKAAAFGTEGKYGFWVVQREPYGTGTHVAFTAADHESVDAFHAAAVAAGGTDNGGPGIREHYHPTYYAAFVLDPDGNNVEAVCHSG
jgi:catechol 2,3-dioxygenase-like lactoylglutathione lyase family enzyme